VARCLKFCEADFGSGVLKSKLARLPFMLASLGYGHSVLTATTLKVSNKLYTRLADAHSLGTRVALTHM
jgi:hypothetical protein